MGVCNFGLCRHSSDAGRSGKLAVMDAESDRRGNAVSTRRESRAKMGDMTKTSKTADPVKPRDSPDSGEERERTEAEDSERGERELGSRAPDFIKASRPLHLSWMVGVFVVGLAVVGAGVLLLPLPGPGWLVIFAGVAIWATEFVWAQVALRWTKRKVTEATRAALDPKVRRRNIALTVVGVVIVAALVAIYLWKFGAVMPWNIGQ
jgi:uncharacterized protein (TIGR02611 family)